MIVSVRREMQQVPCDSSNEQESKKPTIVSPVPSASRSPHQQQELHQGEQNGPRAEEEEHPSKMPRPSVTEPLSSASVVAPASPPSSSQVLSSLQRPPPPPGSGRRRSADGEPYMLSRAVHVNPKNNEEVTTIEKVPVKTIRLPGIGQLFDRQHSGVHSGRIERPLHVHKIRTRMSSNGPVYEKEQGPPPTSGQWSAAPSSHSYPPPSEYGPTPTRGVYSGVPSSGATQDHYIYQGPPPPHHPPPPHYSAASPTASTLAPPPPPPSSSFTRLQPSIHHPPPPPPPYALGYASPPPSTITPTTLSSPRSIPPPAPAPTTLPYYGPPPQPYSYHYSSQDPATSARPPGVGLPPPPGVGTTTHPNHMTLTSTPYDSDDQVSTSSEHHPHPTHHSPQQSHFQPPPPPPTSHPSISHPPPTPTSLPSRIPPTPNRDLTEAEREAERRKSHQEQTRRSRRKMNDKIKKLKQELPNPPPGIEVRHKAQILDFCLTILRDYKERIREGDRIIAGLRERLRGVEKENRRLRRGGK